MPAEALPDHLLRIFELQQQSPVNRLVGGGPVRGIATGNLEVVAANVPLQPNSRLLDFGCGIGRTAAILANAVPSGEVVGIDIMRDAIGFCVQHIAPVMRNTRFHLLDGSNPLYDRHNGDASVAAGPAPADAVELASRYARHFDGAIAFSVFTHFDPAMARRYLAFLYTVTRPRGWVLLTAFLDCPWRPENHCLRPEDRGFRDCDPGLPFNFTLFGTDRFIALAAEAGFRVVRINFGTRDAILPPGMRGGHHPHDVVVLAKIPRLPEGFSDQAYLRANPDVAANGADAKQHYLGWGFFEGRQIA